MRSLSILPILVTHKLQQLNVKREHITKYMKEPDNNVTQENPTDISGNLQNE